MPSDVPPAGRLVAPLTSRAALGLIALLVVFALPDLISPPISPTIVRQTQTFAQTVHFVAGGFSPRALTIDINGPEPFHVVYEFPLYHGIVGLLFSIFGSGYLPGKLVSLIAAAVSLIAWHRLVARNFDEATAWLTSLFFATCPIALLLNTAFQPDALALSLMLGSLLALERWRASPGPSRWLLFLVLVLAAGLAKVTVLVPFFPVVVAAVLRRNGRWHWPTAIEALAALVVFVLPLVGWYLYRGRLMDPAYLVGETDVFFIGDLRRFLHGGYYVKPAFILGAMVCSGAGVGFALAGLRRMNALLGLLLAGVPLYFIVFPTAADQTYYAYPLVPALALLMGRGFAHLTDLAGSRVVLVRLLALGAWFAGLAVAAPYTLRHDDVTFTAARAVQSVSAPPDLLLVLNMHDRGTGIGGFNPSMVTLAERRGWNLQLDSPDPAALFSQIATRKKDGARFVVATWFTPSLDPWFTRFLPASFSRCPRLDAAPVDGAAIAHALAERYPPIARGDNFAVLRID